MGEGVTVVDSLIRGPAIIGDGVHLEEAFIGPYTSIGSDCSLVRCEVENSIVMQGARIEDLPRRMDGSLIGRDVRIARSDGKPKAYRFVLGDGSQIGIT